MDQSLLRRACPAHSSDLATATRDIGKGRNIFGERSTLDQDKEPDVKERLLCASVGAALCLFAGNEMAPYPRTPADSTTSFPPPRSIVNLSGTTTLSPGQTHIAYQVPDDAWLVMTDADRVSSPIDVVDFGVIDGGIFQRLLNATDFSDGYHSTIGLAFPPGSSVAIANNHPSTTATPWWDLTAYLVH